MIKYGHHDFQKIKYGHHDHIPAIVKAMFNIIVYTTQCECEPLFFTKFLHDIEISNMPQLLKWKSLCLTFPQVPTVDRSCSYKRPLRSTTPNSHHICFWKIPHLFITSQLSCIVVKLKGGNESKLQHLCLVSVIVALFVYLSDSPRVTFQCLFATARLAISSKTSLGELCDGSLDNQWPIMVTTDKSDWIHILKVVCTSHRIIVQYFKVKKHSPRRSRSETCFNQIQSTCKFCTWNEGCWYRSLWLIKNNHL